MGGFFSQPDFPAPAPAPAPVDVPPPEPAPAPPAEDPDKAASEDANVRRMRPTFGYVMAATWAAQMGAVAWVVIAAPREAANVIEALGALSVMWSVGLSVLGVYVYKRSADKALAAGRPEAGPFAGLQSLVERR